VLGAAVAGAGCGGGPPTVSCDDTEVVTFEDGRFASREGGTCRSLTAPEARADVVFEGRYRVEGDTFVLEDVVLRSGNRVDPARVGFEPIYWDAVTAPVRYRVEGDRLVLGVRWRGSEPVDLVYTPA
jgi:hypothetical protein